MDAVKILFSRDEYITQRQAKAGGETSPVNRKFYEGGEFMPVHGQGPPSKGKKKNLQQQEKSSRSIKTTSGSNCQRVTGRFKVF